MADFTIRNLVGQGIRIEYVLNEIVYGFLIGSGSEVTFSADSLHPNTQALIDDNIVALGAGPQPAATTVLQTSPMSWAGIWSIRAYSRGNIVRNEGTLWMSLIDGNTSTPGLSEPKWMIFANEDDIATHLADYDNPHHTTAAQAGAIGIEALGAHGGVAVLDGDGLLHLSQFPDLSFDDNVAANTAARHTQNEDTILGSGGSYPVTAQELYDHIRSTNNPHTVTTNQLGALDDSLLGTAGGIATLDGTGRLPSEQWPRSLRLTDTYVVANNSQRDALAPSLLRGDVVAVVNGTRFSAWIWNGSVFIEMAPPSTGIVSVQGLTDARIQLTTTHIPEGTNKYYVASRVADAPSVKALRTKSHDRNKDTFLDYGGGSQVGSAQLKAHLLSHLNPHQTTAAQVGALPAYLTNRTISGNHTVGAADLGVNLRVVNTATITLPNNLPDGFQVMITSVNGNTVTVVGQAHMHASGSHLNTTMGSCIAYYVDATETWEVIGNLV